MKEFILDSKENDVCKKRVLYRQIFRLYSDCSVWTQAFIWGRLQIAPFIQIAGHVPQQGRILDLGCGHGIFSNLLALDSPARQVVGVDIHAEKLVNARRTVQERDNILFVVGDVTKKPLPYSDVTAITMIDLLHHIPYSAQQRLLQWAFNALSDNGIFLIKDVGTKPIWKLWVSYLHDTIINRSGGNLYFIDTDTLETLLRQQGFDTTRIYFMKSPYAHILYVCKKRKGSMS